jgi:hypothetical protein
MVPSNLIVSKYTQGSEFIRADNYASYQGYYYELRGKTYIGKEYNINAVELLKVNSNQVNTLIANPSTAVYGAVSEVNIPQPPTVASLPFQSNSTPTFPNNTSIRFFYKKYNDNIIKEINENGYKSLQPQPIYQTTFIGTYKGKTQTIDQADQQISGLKTWLSV